jgi:hypothetical protein
MMSQQSGTQRNGQMDDASGDRRDEHGRLYAAFEPKRALPALRATQLLLDQQVGSVSSGKLIRRIVMRKQSSEN